MFRAPLIDQIEAHGLAMDQGLISREEAASSLAEYSDGGLTLVGAADTLARWSTARAQYAHLFDDVRATLRRFEGGS